MRREFLVLALVACGNGGESAAPPDAVVTADAAVAYPACVEFAGPAANVPARVTSTLAGADVESPAACAAMNAPYGAESKGPDRVVPIGGLVPGTTYVVKLDATADLAFYVTTGCSTENGPASEQCVLFEDSSLGGAEVAAFVAPAPTVYVVVDFYASQTPASTGFTLAVYRQECVGTADCGGGTPACSDGACVECTSSFDCASSSEPRCDLETNECRAGVDLCAADDAAEPADDGPAGARVIEAGTVASGSVCSEPRAEADFYAFDVTTPGETWDFSLAWSSPRDLDLDLYDASGERLGMSYWEQPERARLTYLPIGRYYARVREFTSGDTAVPYSLLATRAFGAACTSSAECAAEYRNQIYRGSCAAGACVKIDGAGAIPEGGACDSQSDCASTMSCPSFFFVADADTRDTCARGCTNDLQCDDGYVCTTYFAKNFCVRGCTDDTQCPTSLDHPPAAGPWYRLRCNVATGRCTQ